MCLAIPGKITEIYSSNGMRMAKVDFGGVTRETCLEAVPDATLGEYVIVHAGFALNTLSEQDALETLEIFRQMDALADAESELNEPLPG
ncbi:MAG: HypC/HybG/HupF family hydrogenase formation chaperone [Anaerolineaceae bacterium]|jgi:hydrogenase expression/formation protein HypC|nr:HypC/HybG/HupF family hydrogenase formation chaperone [Anaerolineaceae bacterium]